MALTSDCRGNLKQFHKEFKDKYDMDFRVGTEPEMMWLKRGADGKPDGGFSNPYCYHIDPVRIAAAGFHEGHRLLLCHGVGHDSGRP